MPKLMPEAITKNSEYEKEMAYISRILLLSEGDRSIERISAIYSYMTQSQFYHYGFTPNALGLWKTQGGFLQALPFTDPEFYLSHEIPAKYFVFKNGKLLLTKYGKEITDNNQYTDIAGHLSKFDHEQINIFIKMTDNQSYQQIVALLEGWKTADDDYHFIHEAASQITNRPILMNSLEECYYIEYGFVSALEGIKDIKRSVIECIM